MHISKKILAGAVAAYLLSGASAFAGGIVIEPVLNVAPAPVYAPPPPPMYPAYVAPSPAYVVAPYGTYYDPHHRWHNYRYWHDRNHWHDHDDGHWDHH